MYEQGKIHGKHVQKFPDGKEVVHHYTQGRFDGAHEIYYPLVEGKEPVCAVKAFYVDGSLEGEVLEFDEQGCLVALTPYVHGKKEGTAKIWDNKGVLLVSVDLKEDEQHGRLYQYFSSGKLMKEMCFEHNMPVGDEKIYHPNGQVETEAHYIAGKMEGMTRSWNIEGVLVFEGEYKEGKRCGKFNKYYDTGKPKLLQTFVGDELHGVKKCFNEKGEVTESRYAHGKKIS